MAKDKEESKLFVASHLKEITKVLKPWMTNGHYNLLPLLENCCEYSMAFGEKSNGKSTAVQMLMCTIFWLYGAESVLLRCYDEDYKRGRAEGMFKGVPDDFIKYLTKNEYETIIYRNFHWYLGRYNTESNKYELCEKPFCHRICILNAGSSFQYPNVELIFYDEFITPQGNYPGEFVDFQKVCSTIIRLKDSVQIFMMGNTVNYYSVYFNEMGLYNIRKQEQGTIDVYSYNYTYENKKKYMKVAVEYTDTIALKKKSNKYFAFNNPKLEMIKTGAWQIEMYPHLPMRYRPKDVKFSFYIIFDSHALKCEMVSLDSNVFIYIRKMSKDDEDIDFNKDIVYTTVVDSRINISTNIYSPMLFVQKKILHLFSNKKVFYEDNTIGEIVRAYIKTCK